MSSILPTDSISIVPAYGGIITKLARRLSLRRFHAKIACAHRINELPDAAGDVAPQTLPPHVIHHRGMAADVSAVAEHFPVQPLIQPLPFAAQTVIAATRQLEARQK